MLLCFFFARATTLPFSHGDQQKHSMKDLAQVLKNWLSVLVLKSDSTNEQAVGCYANCF
jgi:hypothetical protein